MHTKNHIQVSITVLIKFVLFTMLSSSYLIAHADEEENGFVRIKLVEGTDQGYEDRIDQAFASNPDFVKQQNEDRKLVRDEQSAMKNMGYIVTDEENVNIFSDIVSSPNVVDQASVYPSLGFNPAAFDLGYEIKGVIPDESKDGKIHYLTTIIDHYALGILTIEERSIATEPKGKRAKYLYGPKFDLTISGNPALLRAYQTSDGKKSRSSLSVLSKEKLLSVGIGRVIEEGSNEYNILTEIASSAM